MAISIGNLRKYMSLTVGGGGPSFDEKFVYAVNSVITDFNRQCNRSVANIENTSGNIDLDQKYENVFFRGGLYYLYASSEWAKEPDPQAEYKYQRALAMAQFEAIQDDDPDVGFVDPA